MSGQSNEKRNYLSVAYISSLITGAVVYVQSKLSYNSTVLPNITEDGDILYKLYADNTYAAIGSSGAAPIPGTIAVGDSSPKTVDFTSLSVTIPTVLFFRTSDGTNDPNVNWKISAKNVIITALGSTFDTAYNFVIKT